MERVVIDGSELRDLIDANAPALKLVPGSVAVAARPGPDEDQGDFTERKTPPGALEIR
jgi:hypothetical protein